MTIFVETERLILREVLLTDVDGMFELDSNPIVHKYMGTKPIKAIGEALKSINYIRQQYQDNNIGRWAVIEKSSGDFIGWSGLKLNTEEPMNGCTNFYDIGFRLIPQYWGKGYATESALAAMDYAFNNMNLDMVCGLADVNNAASNAILKKIGLKFKNDFWFENQKVAWYELNKDDYGKKMP